MGDLRERKVWTSLQGLSRGRYGVEMLNLAGHLTIVDFKSVERWTGEQWVEEEKGLQGRFAYGGAVVV